jgi:phosphoribosyl 1,2-cyclic phosphodiesterase
VRAHLCGVRGSSPAVGAAFAGVGGHTSCIALRHDGDTDPDGDSNLRPDRDPDLRPDRDPYHRPTRGPTSGPTGGTDGDPGAAPSLLLDAGTGLRLVSGLLDGHPFRGTILLGHLHWDHTQGLPFFDAANRHDARTRVLVPEQGVPAIELFERFMSPPAFPVGPRQLSGDWSFGSVDEGPQRIEGFEVLAREIPHKGGRTFGYRISDGRGAMAYLSDHGPRALGPGPDGLGPYHEAAVALCEGVDVLVHDAQHTAAELPRRAHLGHSAAEYAVGLARHCGVGRVVLFHHDPERTDGQVVDLERTLRLGDGPIVEAAREGADLCVAAPLARPAVRRPVRSPLRPSAAGD